jgi:hypothetical protein
MISSADLLLQEVEKFMERHSMTPTVFGLECANDGHLVRDLRLGKQVTLRTSDKIRAFMENYRTRSSRRSARKRPAEDQVA